jgi:hypothetical protein
VRAIKSWWFILAFVSGFTLAMMAEELVLNWRNDRLEFSAPRVHFLRGQPLEMLHNAAPVPFNFNVTIWSGNHNHVFQRIPERFVISYDLWEEKFKVVKTLSPRRVAEHLTADKAEAWCWEQMSLASDTSGLAGSELFWTGFEIRAEDGRSGPLFGRGNITDSGISLTSLIELFSRPPGAQQSHWGPFEAGPYTLDELKRSTRRGF